MQQNKQTENTFKITLFQEKDLIIERIFNADVISPAIRSSVDIRCILSSIISKFQKTLSKREYYYEMEIKDDLIYDFLEYKNMMVDLYPQKIRDVINKQPEVKKQVIEDKIIKGVEFKFNFYINDNLIVERIFYVNGYNNEVRYSNEIVYLINDVANKIYNFLKKNDVNHMWEDYALINKYNYTIQQVRELPKMKRDDLLRKLY
jgi:hypothetical protein